MKSATLEVVIERTQTQSTMVAPVLLAVDVGVDETVLERTKSALRALVTALSSTVYVNKPHLVTCFVNVAGDYFFPIISSCTNACPTAQVGNVGNIRSQANWRVRLILSHAARASHSHLFWREDFV